MALAYTTCLWFCQSNEETALHLAILQDDGSSLYMVDFIIQNTNRSVSQSVLEVTK